MAKLTPAAAVRNGLDVLNNVLGREWVRSIDLENFDMAGRYYLPAAYCAYAVGGACGCMLAQLNHNGNALGNGAPPEQYGEYDTGLNCLVKLVPCDGTEWDEDEFAVIHGFFAPADASDDAYYRKLQYNWVRAVKRQLRELDAVVAV